MGGALREDNWSQPHLRPVLHGGFDVSYVWTNVVTLQIMW